jgi:hypothetical protein
MIPEIDYFPIENSGENICSFRERDPWALFGPVKYKLKPLYLIVTDYEMDELGRYEGEGDYLLFQCGRDIDYNTITSLN